jgi:hypothetical protein
MNRDSATIDVEVMCTWLGLAPGSWPPNHYVLLGLPLGEADVERIEHSVHERLMRIRCYQLSHPCQATEAMMRLAKAWDCLTNPQSKKEYDAIHCPQASAPQPAARVQTALLHDTVETAPVPGEPSNGAWWTTPSADWQRASLPPPVRLGGDTAALPPVRAKADLAAPPVRVDPATLTPKPAPVPPDAHTPPPVRGGTADLSQAPTFSTPPVRSEIATASKAGPPNFPVVSPPDPPPSNGNAAAVPISRPAAVANGAAHSSGATAVMSAPLTESGKIRAIYLSHAAMRDVGTRRDLYERVLWTRRLSRSWLRIGKYMKPKRKLTKPAEEAELTRILAEIDELVHENPDVLGQPGQPGYRLLALATQEPVAARFKALDELDREALSRDWDAGKMLLAEYREFLKSKVVGHRRLSPMQRLRVLADAFAAAYWMWVVFGIGVLGVLVLAAVWVS